MSGLSDMEERVLGVLGERSRLELEQIASTAHLSAAMTREALEGLIRRKLVKVSPGRFGSLYEVNRQTAQQLIAAA